MRKAAQRFILFGFIFILSGSVLANGLSLNSIGPRALGMGGAFVGLADDYSAIYWNPAGLYNLEGTYVGAFVTDVIPVGTYKMAAFGIDTKTKMNHYISPNLMAYWQCLLTDKLKIGLGAYVPAGLGSEWDGADLAAFSGGKSLKWMSKIGVFNISPAVSFQATEKLTLGIADNVYYGMFDMKRPAALRDPMGNVVDFAQYSESSTGLGYGVTLGALLRVNEFFSMGLSFRTKTKVSMSGNAENPGMAAAGYATKSDFDRDVAWPMWVAGGFAVKPTEKLTLTMDFQWSQWSESEKTFTTKFKDAAWAAGAKMTGDDTFKLYWKDATQMRFGAEYQLMQMLALRGGFYVDPAPAPAETYNILFPSISYYGVTAGTTVKFGSLNIDAGFEYLKGMERNIELGQYADAVPGTHNMDIIAVSIGAGYTF